MILNRIAEVQAPNSRALPRPLRHVVVHKTSLSQIEPHNPRPVPDADLDVVTLAAAFCRGPMASYTRGLFPYHILVLPSGVIEQALPLDIQAAHAGAHNAYSLAVAAVGEHGPLTDSQQRALIVVCADLMRLERVSLAGHIDLPDASRDPRKICPGPHIHMRELVTSVREILPPDWRVRDRDYVARELESRGYQLHAAIKAA